MEPEAFDRLRRLDALAVRISLDLAHRITPEDFVRPTPCAAWTLGELLAHLTAQHLGFAAAARGRGGEPDRWAVGPVTDDLPKRHEAAAAEALAAFAELAGPEPLFALPEFSSPLPFPAGRAVGFHLVDAVAHGWDLAATLGLDYHADPELLDAALVVALAVPDDDSRLAPGSAFEPALPAEPGSSPLDRILVALGRSPQWGGPDGYGRPAADDVERPRPEPLR